jgi:spore maturation protein SpmB
MFQGFFEWVMGVITYVLSFFGIIISKPAAATAATDTVSGGSAITDAVVEEAVVPASLSSDSSE